MGGGQRQACHIGPVHLSKSRYVAGLQCHRLLWWKVHEPAAKELEPDKVLQDRFDQGAQVGALARERFPGGLLIEGDRGAFAERIAATQTAMDAGAPAIFEASFMADDTFVAVDVLLREDAASRRPTAASRWSLIEVKSTSSQKDEHVDDVAVQLHVLTRSGVNVAAQEVMHLNKDCHYPDFTNLFQRTDVTEASRAKQPEIPTQLEEQLAMLARPEPPPVRIGLHCHEPYACPFMDRCWPRDADHIGNLYLVGPKTCEKYMLTGVHRIGDIPTKEKLNATAKRQIRAMETGQMIVEPGLARALEPFDVPRLGFLDFETINRAVPVWPGMTPWEPAAAQFSYHELRRGSPGRSERSEEPALVTHVEFLAEGSDDARPLLARAMVQATARVDRVVTYSGYEKARIRQLQRVVPELATELLELEGKLIDLLPVIRENVYHPDFHGSFSIKCVLPPMVPGLTYDDLIIIDGLTASVEIARLLFVANKIPVGERERVRKNLLDYCERDTWAMVKLLERLRELVRLPLRLV